MSRTNGNYSTVYIGGLLEVDETGATVTASRTFYRLAGRSAAVREHEAGETTFVVQNHLGSAVASFNNDTDTQAQVRYGPFGTERSTSGTQPSDVRFTGQIADNTASASGGTNTLFYNARYFDPAVGAFVAPDPLVADSSTPADLNRYAYVRNNPVANVDPTGHVTLNTAKIADGGDCPVGVGQCGGAFTSVLLSRIADGALDGKTATEVILGLANSDDLERDSLFRDIAEAGGYDYQSGARSRAHTSSPSLRPYWKADRGLSGGQSAAAAGEDVLNAVPASVDAVLASADAHAERIRTRDQHNQTVHGLLGSEGGYPTNMGFWNGGRGSLRVSWALKK